jgi:heme A synthase
MTPAPATPRTFADRLTRVLALVTVLATAVLLLLGGMVTSFRVGMADPVWPTEPWYLVVNQQEWREENAGFLIEHTHRAAGFVVGGLASLLALAAWFTERRLGLKLAGLAAVVVLLAVYGQFHREMGVAWKGREAGLTWPKGSAAACLAAAVAVVGLAAASARSRGGWARLLASVGLLAVMIQGLLGGFRVFLDQLMGTELAAVHGTFAQVVFCLLVVVFILSAPLRPGREVAAEDRRRLGWLAVALVGLIFAQLVWGVLLRHTGTVLSQRLHVLTAFLVTVAAVWLAVSALATPTGRRRLGFYAWHLLAILLLQVSLGVEAWMGKFAAAGPEAARPPMLRSVTIQQASIRTAHVLVGTGLLAVSVGFAVRVWRRPAVPVTVPAEEPRLAPAGVT